MLIITSICECFLYFSRYRFAHFKMWSLIDVVFLSLTVAALTKCREASCSRSEGGSTWPPALTLSGSMGSRESWISAWGPSGLAIQSCMQGTGAGVCGPRRLRVAFGPGGSRHSESSVAIGTVDSVGLQVRCPSIRSRESKDAEVGN